jgi:hypothetical protein
VVLEEGTELAPGGRATARAWVVLPDELPRSLETGTVVTLLEGDRIVGRAEVLGLHEDATPSPLSDLGAAKRRTLMPVTARP